MPACDGSTCTKSIPWRITPSALQMPTGTVPFSVETAYGSLLSVLVAAKCPEVAPRKKSVVFKNLCKACWDAQAGAWGDAGTYAAARARTTPDAIYLQVTSTDFQVGGRYDNEAILSCATHELMHYWSHLGVGLQSYNRTANVDWDEAVADILGFMVYRGMYRGTSGLASYVTPYNTYCQALKRVPTFFGNVFPRLWREPADCNRLPTVVSQYISKGKAEQPTLQQQLRGQAAELLVQVLSRYLFTWFFAGPQAWLDDGGQKVDINRFLEGGNLSNMFAVAQVFQPYYGNNTIHAI